MAILQDAVLFSPFTKFMCTNKVTGSKSIQAKTMLSEYYRKYYVGIVLAQFTFLSKEKYTKITDFDPLLDKNL